MDNPNEIEMFSPEEMQSAFEESVELQLSAVIRNFRIPSDNCDEPGVMMYNLDAIDISFRLWQADRRFEHESKIRRQISWVLKIVTRKFGRVKDSSYLCTHTTLWNREAFGAFGISRQQPRHIIPFSKATSCVPPLQRRRMLVCRNGSTTWLLY